MQRLRNQQRVQPPYREPQPAPQLIRPDNSPWPGLQPPRTDGFPANVDPADFVRKTQYEADRILDQRRLEAALAAVGGDVDAAREAARDVDTRLATLTATVNQAQGTALTPQEMTVALNQFRQEIQREIDAQVAAGSTISEARQTAINKQLETLRQSAAGDPARLQKIEDANAEVQAELRRAEEKGQEPDWLLIAGILAGVGGGGAYIRGVQKDLGNKAEKAKSEQERRVEKAEDKLADLREALTSLPKSSEFRALMERLDEDKNGIPDLIEKAVGARMPLLKDIAESVAERAAKRVTDEWEE